MHLVNIFDHSVRVAFCPTHHQQILFLAADGVTLTVSIAFITKIVYQMSQTKLQNQ